MKPDHLKTGLASAVISLFLLTPAAAEDENFDNLIEYTGRAVAIDQPRPKSPRRRARKLQEAWVRMSYVVTSDGQVIDPLIIDSSGGIDFENELKNASELWVYESFEEPAELPMNLVEARFTIIGRGKGTTRTFARHSLHIMKALHNDDVEKARKNADSAVRLAGWNLYESTILWLMLGRVAGAERNSTEQLEMYQRALAVSTPKSLRRDARADLLEDIFELQIGLGQYAAAERSFEKLKKVKDSAETVARVSSQAAEIATKLAADATVIAQATIANPCNCEGGVPLWHYIPDRRTFSFDNMNGNVTSFEARCNARRISGDVVTGQKWSLPDDWGYCEVFVFGDDGASFNFLTHLQGAGIDDVQGEAVVAANHGVDSRN